MFGDLRNPYFTNIMWMQTFVKGIFAHQRDVCYNLYEIAVNDLRKFKSFTATSCKMYHMSR